MKEKCWIVGPYYPVGDVDWVCRTHQVDVTLRDPSRAGAHDLRRDEFVCQFEGGYCAKCGVTADLHGDADSCESAQMKANVIEKFWSVVQP